MSVMRLGFFFSLILWTVGITAFVLASRAFAADGAPTMSPAIAGIDCDTTKTLGPNEDYQAIQAVFSDCITGGTGSNTIYLGAGRDYANGILGSDIISGGSYQDVLYGGLSGDRINADDGDDYLYAGCPSTCDQTGENVYDVLGGGSGNDTLAGANNKYTDFQCGPGADIVYYDAGLDNVPGDCEDKRPQ